MKMKLWLMSLVCLLSMGTLSQAAAGPLGLGVNLGSGGFGGHVSFALQPNLELGAQLGLGIYAAGGSSATVLILNPYARFMLGGSKSFAPYIKGQLDIGMGGSSYDEYATTASGVGIEAALGLRTKIDQQLALSGEITVLSIAFADDYSLIGLGALTPSLWATWYF